MATIKNILTFPLWRDEANKVPIFMTDTDDGPYTGLVNTDVSFQYTRHSDSDLATLSPTVDQWEERGGGMYALTLPDTFANETGFWMGKIVPTPTGVNQVGGYGMMDYRVTPERFLAATPSGYNVGTVGKALEEVEKFEVFCAPRYDHEGGVLGFAVWLHRNCLLVTTPTTARVTVADEDNVTVCDKTNSSPNANGMFYIEKDPQDPLLVAKRVYRVKVQVTYNGTQYASGEVLFTLG